MSESEDLGITRRHLLLTGGLVVAGCSHGKQPAPPAESGQAGKTGLGLSESAQTAPSQATSKAAPEPEQAPRIRRTRVLGRTGFAASDLGMGCGFIASPNVVRHAVDRGINLFDTAEGYGNGDSEKKIGEAMPHLDRSKVFIVTKLIVKPEEKAQSLVDRFQASLERMRTPYADALDLHGASRVGDVANPAFHEATARLKADGKIRFVGVSCHGPHEANEDPMDKVLCAAAEDGRFDLMLFVYSYLNRAEGERVLAACQARNIGTTGMKAIPRSIMVQIEPFDPANPTELYKRSIDRMLQLGMTREKAIEQVKQFVKSQEPVIAELRGEIDAFIQRFGIRAAEDVRLKGVQFALQDARMHSVVVSMPDFESVDKFLPLSGSSLDAASLRLLEAYRQSFGRAHCRHGCQACLSLCPHGVPVSRVMRYAGYFEQGRERLAMEKYGRLACPAEACLACDAPCRAGCPFGFPIQAELVQAHTRLSLA